MLKSANYNKICISFILIIYFISAKPTNAECIWIKKSNGLAGYELTSIAIDKENPGILYVGSRGFLFKTIDGGQSWKEIFKVPGISKAVNFIAVDPHDSKIIYIATESGIFKSSVSGLSWQSASGSLKKDNVLSLHIDSKDKDTLFAATEKDIFITEDAGKNWVKSSEGLSAVNIKSIAQNHLNPQTLFACAENGLFKSEDRAKTWKKIFPIHSVIEELDFDSNYDYEEANDDFSNFHSWVALHPSNPEIVYLSANRAIFKSEDNGNSWSRLSRMGLLNSEIKNLVIPPDNDFVFVTTEEGVFRFSEKEKLWQEFYGGLDSKKIVFLALNPLQDSLWLVATDGVYKSKSDIYEVKEISSSDKVEIILQNFAYEPSYQEIQNAAIEYAEVHPDKIAQWRKAVKAKALLPRLTLGIERDSSKSLHWDSGVNPDTWVIGPEEEETGWDITCSWDLGELIWNDSQTSIDVRSKLMVQLRDDILDEVTHLYFERRKLQIELLQNPPKDVDKLVERQLRLEELTASIDAMTGGYLSREIARRRGK